MLRELVDMLGPDGLRLAALDFFLWAVVAAFGPVRFCSTDLALYFGWDPPPGPLVPALLKLRRLLLGHGSGAALAGSPTAIFRADLHGPAALWLSAFLWLGAAALLAALRVPFPLPLFGEGRSPFFHLGLVAALVFLPVVLFLPGRAVVRGLLCAECLSGIGEPYDGGGQENPCGQREGAERCTGEIFREREGARGGGCSEKEPCQVSVRASRGLQCRGGEEGCGCDAAGRGAEKTGWRFDWWCVLVPLMVLPAALPLVMVRAESGMRAALGAPASRLRPALLPVFALAWAVLLLAETALLMAASLGVVNLVVF